MNRPVKCVWDGEALRPASTYWAKVADEQFVIGAAHMVEERDERSDASHRHYHACINEAWKSLSDEAAERFTSADMLRKWALIRAGYRDERSIACGSRAEALRVAAFIRPMGEHAAVTVHEATVVVLTAKSQSYRAMGKEQFYASKEAVLAIISEMLGVEPEALQQHAREAA